MHVWGEPGVDWGGINDAAYFIAKWLKIGGVHVFDYKEKWGTVRVYCSVRGPLQEVLYTLIYKLAIKKWPHLKTEIVCAADYPELLEKLCL
jgi:hypothetical protein